MMPLPTSFSKLRKCRKVLQGACLPNTRRVRTFERNICTLLLLVCNSRTAKRHVSTSWSPTHCQVLLRDTGLATMRLLIGKLTDAIAEHAVQLQHVQQPYASILSCCWQLCLSSHYIMSAGTTPAADSRQWQSV
jgi:hypothetical protein